MKQFYNAILTTAADGYITVAFPDFPGCVSGGESISDALIAGQEALHFHLEGMIEDNEPIPAESDNAALMELLNFSKEHGDDCKIAVVELEVPDQEPARINVSLPRHILSKIDQYAKKHHRTRSAFLAESAIDYIRNH